MSDATTRRPIVWRSFGLSDVGCVRKVNEDTVLASPDKNFWAVLDGMGGHQVGDVASQKVAQCLAELNEHECLSDGVDAVEDKLLQANQALLDYAAEHFGKQTMGSTAVCLLINGQVGVAMWVGDSRLYRLRQNHLQQLTRDHSQLEEMLQMNALSPEEAEAYPYKNVITRAVGVEAQLFVDISVFGVQMGDTFLLCSDGLYNSVSLEDISETLGENDAEKSAQKLMKTALDNEANDNVSVVVVKGKPESVRKNV